MGGPSAPVVPVLALALVVDVETTALNLPACGRIRAWEESLSMSSSTNVL